MSYIVDTGGDASDHRKLSDAISSARSAVFEYHDPAATVYPSGDDYERPPSLKLPKGWLHPYPVFAIWEVSRNRRGGPPDAILETNVHRLALDVHRRHVTSSTRATAPTIPVRLAGMIAEGWRLHDNDFYEESADTFDVAADALETEGFAYEAAVARANALRLRVYIFVERKLPHLRGSFTPEEVRAKQHGRNWIFEILIPGERRFQWDTLDARLAGTSRKLTFIPSEVLTRELASARHYAKTVAPQIARSQSARSSRDGRPNRSQLRRRGRGSRVIASR